MTRHFHVDERPIYKTGYRGHRGMAIAVGLLHAILPPACVYAHPPRSGLAGHQTKNWCSHTDRASLFFSGRSIAFQGAHRVCNRFWIKRNESVSVVLEDMDEDNSAHPGLRWPSCDVSQSVRLLVVEKIQYLVPARSGFRFKPAQRLAWLAASVRHRTMCCPGAVARKIYNFANRRLDRGPIL